MLTCSFPSSGVNTLSEPSLGFPDPYADFASTALPMDLQRGLQLSEFLFLANPFIAAASRRVSSFFATELAMTRADGNPLGDELGKWETALRDDLHLVARVPELGMNFDCYGNLFVSVIEKFRRFLVCRECQESGRSTLVALTEVLDNPKRYSFRWKCPKFHFKCPQCGHDGPAKRRDIRLNGVSGLAVKLWSPHEIHIDYEETTDTRTYYWRPSAEFSVKVKRGDPSILLHTPYEYILTVAKRCLLRFDPDYIYHARQPSLTGLKTKGWAIPKTLINFRPAWYTQLLLRQNEAIVIDYLMPIRSITPEVAASGTREDDPFGSYNLSDLRYQVERAVAHHRTDPMGYYFFPKPLKYSLWGGEARQLAPAELIDQAVSMLLNACDVPVEMYKGTVSLQMAMQTIQLFMQNHSAFVDAMNGAMLFVAKRVAQSQRWEPARASLVKPTIVQDVQMMLAKLQMAQQEQFSLTDAYKLFGAEFKDQTRKIVDEKKFRDETLQQLQEEEDSAAAGKQLGAPPQQPGQPGQPGQPQAGPGGAPGQPGMNAGVGAMPTSEPETVEELQAWAESIVPQVKAMDQSTRRSYLIRLKKFSESLHAAVRAGMNNIDNQAKTQGKQQVLTQNFGQSV